MSKKYVFIDIDGTLLSHQMGIPDSTKQAIVLARSNGHKIYINTGRTKSAVDVIIRTLPLDGFVYAAGGHVEVGDKTIFENILEKSEVDMFVELFEKEGVGYILEGSTASYYNDLAIAYFNEKLTEKRKLKPQVARHLVQENMVAPLSHYFLSPSPINKVSLFSKDVKDLYEINEQLPEKYQFIIYDENASGEIITRGIDKSFGIRKVIELYDAHMSETMALGDSMNDYEMVKESGIGIAMGNAHDKLKAVADYVTFDVDDAGIFHAFKYFNLI